MAQTKIGGVDVTLSPADTERVIHEIEMREAEMIANAEILASKYARLLLSNTLTAYEREQAEENYKRWIIASSTSNLFSRA